MCKLKKSSISLVTFFFNKFYTKNAQKTAENLTLMTLVPKTFPINRRTLDPYSPQSSLKNGQHLHTYISILIVAELSKEGNLRMD